MSNKEKVMKKRIGWDGCKNLYGFLGLSLFLISQNKCCVDLGVALVGFGRKEK